jgi:hypothetical protein
MATKMAGCTRRDFLKAAGAMMAVPGCTTNPTMEIRSSSARGPNFVFFLVDDLGWTDLGCYGSTFYETPNIDRLAAEGMRFTQHYSGSPVCAPSRCVLLTGERSLITAEHALHVLEIMQACRQSYRTKRYIEIETTFDWPIIA